MGFELHISCSKDIDELHINFSDGSSSIVESTKKPPSTKKPSTKKSMIGEELDLEADFSNDPGEIIKPPDIQRKDRPIKIADELQNLDF